MRDYKKYAQDLRRIAQFQNCFECYEGERTEGSCSSYCTLNKAADAIEELLAAVRSVVRCKECEWWTKQEASIQGRCARLAIYPTGEFYCASGSKPEPPKGVE